MVTDNSYKKQEKEFEVFKQRFTKLIDYLKDVKNLGKNYREMTRNIDFSRKQKLEDDYDQGKYEEIGENIHEYIKSPMPHRSTLNLKNINEKEEEENLETVKNQNIDENKKIEKNTNFNSVKTKKSANIDLFTITEKNNVIKKSLFNPVNNDVIRKNSNMKISSKLKLSIIDDSPITDNKNVCSEFKLINTKKERINTENKSLRIK